MFITLYNNNIQDKQLDVLASMLENDGIIVIPTDTLYAFVCDIDNHKAAKQLALLKGKALEKSNFSILCENLSQASQYVKPLSKDQFSFIKAQETGGFTFVLPASNLTPKIFQSKKKTIGIRIPEHKVALELIKRIGKPLLVSSLPHPEDLEEEYYTNAELIYEEYKSKVSAVVECEGVSNIPSTVVNMVDSSEFVTEREGLGQIQ